MSSVTIIEPQPVHHSPSHKKSFSFYNVSRSNSEAHSYTDSEATLKDDCNQSVWSIARSSVFGSEKEKEKEKEKLQLRSIILTCAASLAGFLFGFDTGTISGFLEMDSFKKQFGDLNSEGEYYLHSLRSGLFVSAISMGGLIGGLSAAKFSEKFGRTKSVMGYILLYLCALIQMVNARTWVHYFISRIMLGTAIGSYTLIIPMLLSESAPNSYREFIVSLFQLFITLGLFLGNIIVFGCHNIESRKSYQIPIITAICIAVILFFVMLWMPESPRYLLAKGKIDEAKKSISRFRNVDPESNYVFNEVQTMLSAINKDRAAGNASWKEMFIGRPRLCFRLFVGISIQIFQLFCGANYFFYYGTSLFRQIGGMSPFAPPIILSTVNVSCTILGLAIVSKFSRRFVLLTGAFGMFLAFMFFSSFGNFLFHPADGTVGQTLSPESIRIGRSMIFFASLFILFYASTWAPLAYVILSEIFPQRIRPKAMSLGCASNWSLNILVNLFTPSIISRIGFSIGYIFAGFLLTAFIFTIFCVHETKGLTLEETDVMYASNISAINSSSRVYREFEKSNEQLP